MRVSDTTDNFRPYRKGKVYHTGISIKDKNVFREFVAMEVTLLWVYSCQCKTPTWVVQWKDADYKMKAGTSRTSPWMVEYYLISVFFGLRLRWITAWFFVLYNNVLLYYPFLLYGILLYHTHIVNLILVGLVALWVMQAPGSENGRICWNNNNKKKKKGNTSGSAVLILITNCQSILPVAFFFFFFFFLQHTAPPLPTMQLSRC